MAFRRHIPIRELAEKMTPEDCEAAATDYVPSRGGWLPSPKKKPVPGTPKPKKGR